MDLIDKAKLETFMNDWMLNVSGDGYEKMSKRKQAMYDTLEQVFDAVSRFPTIDPGTLRPVAHWNGQYDGYFDGEPVCDVWECSNCGHIIDDGTDCEDNLPRYCPSCGAKMEGDNA